jgi:hypothetical protein
MLTCFPFYDSRERDEEDWKTIFHCGHCSFSSLEARTIKEIPSTGIMFALLVMKEIITFVVLLYISDLVFMWIPKNKGAKYRYRS